MALAQEIELKFAGGDFAAMQARLEDMVGDATAWQSENLRSVYFDTADETLRQRGLSFRIRSGGLTHVQTIKGRAESSGGLLKRQEWEQRIGTFEPTFTHLPAAAEKALNGVLLTDLQACVEVNVTRKKVVIEKANPFGSPLKVEIAIDQGFVQAGEARQNIAECELELQQGDATQFFQLALDAQVGTAMRLSRRTKSEQAYRLRDTLSEDAHFVPKFAAENKQSISEFFQIVLGPCVANLIDNEAAACAGSDIEAVHQMRVSVRRMRSLLSIFGKWIEAERIDWLRDELKWLGGALGDARDWDVFITETAAVLQGYGVNDAAVDWLREVASEERARAYDAVRETLTSDRYAAFILRLTGFIAVQGWTATPMPSSSPLNRKISSLSGKVLTKRFNRVLLTGGDMVEKTIEERHEVRIQLKKLRYAVDFLQDLYAGAEKRAFQKRLRRLQDFFGHLNDIAQIARMTAILQDRHQPLSPLAAEAIGLLKGWHAHSLSSLESDFLTDWKSFVGAQPFWQHHRRDDNKNDHGTKLIQVA